MKGCFFSEMLEFSLIMPGPSYIGRTMSEPNYVREVGWDLLYPSMAHDTPLPPALRCRQLVWPILESFVAAMFSFPHALRRTTPLVQMHLKLSAKGCSTV
jgi:hypothetical protein